MVWATWLLEFSGGADDIIVSRSYQLPSKVFHSVLSPVQRNSKQSVLKGKVYCLLHSYSMIFPEKVYTSSLKEEQSGLISLQIQG